MSASMSKHDSGCEGRGAGDPHRYLCTCGLTDDEVRTEMRRRARNGGATVRARDGVATATRVDGGYTLQVTDSQVGESAAVTLSYEQAHDLAAALIDNRPDAWRCDACEYVHPEPETPEECPACDVGRFGSWTGHSVALQQKEAQ